MIWDHRVYADLQPKHQVGALDAAITLAWTDEPGDTDHGDKRTPHLSTHEDSDRVKTIAIGGSNPDNNLTLDTFGRCQSPFQTDTR